MNKKIYSIIPFLALILIFSFALAACSGGSEASTTTEKNEEEIIGNVAEEEIVEEAITKDEETEEENAEEAENVNTEVTESFVPDQTHFVTEVSIFVDDFMKARRNPRTKVRGTCLKAELCGCFATLPFGSYNSG